MSCTSLRVIPLVAVRAAAAAVVRVPAGPADTGPVAAQGVAQASILLGDASGPLYHRASGGDLRASVRAKADAMTFDDDTSGWYLRPASPYRARPLRCPDARLTTWRHPHRSGFTASASR
jgi:hypothetical protein